MREIKRWRLGIVLILLLAVLPGCTSASAASVNMLESRISRLETDYYQTRARINRLESQVFGLAQSPSRISRANTPAPPPTPRANRRVSSDPVFNRLATLVIELKERISKLEAEVASLKKTVSD